jgi:hypothetical protein
MEKEFNISEQPTPNSTVSTTNNYQLMKFFNNGRRIIFLYNNSPLCSKRMEWMNSALLDDISAICMAVLDEGKVKYSFKKPTKLFDPGTTADKAENLGKIWETLLQLGFPYKALDRLSWKELEKKSSKLNLTGE